MKKYSHLNNLAAFFKSKKRGFSAFPFHPLFTPVNFNGFLSQNRRILTIRTNQKDHQIKLNLQLSQSGSLLNRLLRTMGQFFSLCRQKFPHSAGKLSLIAKSNYISQNPNDQVFVLLKKSTELINQSGSNNISISANL